MHNAHFLIIHYKLFIMLLVNRWEQRKWKKRGVTTPNAQFTMLNYELCIKFVGGHYIIEGKYLSVRNKLGNKIVTPANSAGVTILLFK